jgi:hypothetical protein
MFSPKRKKIGKKAAKVATDEYSLQVWANSYYQAVLIKGEAKYEGHESSIGLGFMRYSPKDTPARIRFKQEYNKFFQRFVLPIQAKFQAKGVSKGSSDGFLFKRGMTICHEYKVDYNKATAEQLEFAAEMAALDNPTEWPRSQEDVIAIPRKYGIRTRDITI